MRQSIARGLAASHTNKKTRAISRGATLVPACLLLASCAHVDTGQADYRIAEPPSIETAADLRPRKCAVENIRDDCQSFLPARVMRRYMPSKDGRAQPMTAGTIYSMEIDQGVIGSNILEGFLLGKQVGTNAEFAILANVFEFADDEKGAKAKRFVEMGAQPGDLTSGTDPSDVELKLVYFSSDVEKRQPFSFSNIPLQPRSAYRGGSLGVQIVIMEIDANGPLRSLLTTLARFGQQAVPGSSEVKDMIFDLGESIFSSSSQDDTLFNYRFVLSANGGVDDARAAVVPGRYVVRRGQDRTKDMRWDDLRLDHNSGRLLRVSTTGGDMSEVKEELYLTLSIKPYPTGTKPEFYHLESFAKFRKNLEDAAEVSGTPVKTLTADLGAMLKERRSEQWGAALDAKWAVAETALKKFSAIYVADASPANFTTCKVDPTLLKAGADRAERDALDAVNAFVALYRSSTKPLLDAQGKPEDTEFTAADRAALLSTVARYFMPWADGDKASFADQAAFEKAFVTPGDAALASRAVAVAKLRGPAATCDELMMRGLATQLDTPPAGT